MWLVDRCAEELETTHVGGALDLNPALATLLDDLLQQLGWILFGLLLLWLVGSLISSFKFTEICVFSEETALVFSKKQFLYFRIIPTNSNMDNSDTD